MIAGIASRVLRPQAAAVGGRQQVSARSDSGVSKRLARIVTLIVGVSLFIVFAFSQVMHWHIISTVNKLDELQSVRNEYGSENIALLAARAQLTSRDYVVKEAGSRYQLYIPQKSQVRRL